MKSEKTAGKNRRVRKKKSRLGRHRKSVLMISAVLVMLCGVLTVNSFTLMAKNRNYEEQERELQDQIEEQKERAKEIEEYKEYVNSDEYVKEAAEEDLGLELAGRRIIKTAQ